MDNSILVESTVVAKLVREVQRIYGNFLFRTILVSLKVIAHYLVIKVFCEFFILTYLALKG